MKRIYLALLGCILAGSLAAQTDNAAKKTTINKEDVKKNYSASVAGQASSVKADEVNADYAGLPGFPAYQNTGNKELDDANYATAKANWIKENQTMYDEYMSKKTVNTPNTNQTAK